MMGTEANDDPRCFWRADVNQAARALLDVIRQVRPQVLVTYDANGFYGHPDHIQAHRVACRAFQQATDLGLAKFYATAGPESDGVTTEIDATAYFDAKLAAMRAPTLSPAPNAPGPRAAPGTRSVTDLAFTFAPALIRRSMVASTPSSVRLRPRVTRDP